MGKEEKQELKDRGFFILEKVHLFITVLVIVIGFIVSTIVQKEILAYTVEDHEVRIKSLENTNQEKHDLLLELKYNLKSLMEKSGIKYQDLSNK